MHIGSWIRCIVQAAACIVSARSGNPAICSDAAKMEELGVQECCRRGTFEISYRAVHIKYFLEVA